MGDYDDFVQYTSGASERPAAIGTGGKGYGGDPHSWSPGPQAGAAAAAPPVLVHSNGGFPYTAVGGQFAVAPPGAYQPVRYMHPSAMGIHHTMEAMANNPLANPGAGIAFELPASYSHQFSHDYQHQLAVAYPALHPTSHSHQRTTYIGQAEKKDVRPKFRKEDFAKKSSAPDAMSQLDAFKVAAKKDSEIQRAAKHTGLTAGPYDSHVTSGFAGQAVAAYSALPPAGSLGTSSYQPSELVTVASAQGLQMPATSHVNGHWYATSPSPDPYLYTAAAGSCGVAADAHVGATVSLHIGEGAAAVRPESAHHAYHGLPVHADRYAAVAHAAMHSDHRSAANNGFVQLTTSTPAAHGVLPLNAVDTQATSTPTQDDFDDFMSYRAPADAALNSPAATATAAAPAHDPPPVVHQSPPLVHSSFSGVYQTPHEVVHSLPTIHHSPKAVHESPAVAHSLPRAMDHPPPALPPPPTGMSQSPTAARLSLPIVFPSPPAVPTVSKSAVRKGSLRLQPKTKKDAPVQKIGVIFKKYLDSDTFARAADEHCSMPNNGTGRSSSSESNQWNDFVSSNGISSSQDSGRDFGDLQSLPSAPAWPASAHAFEHQIVAANARGSMSKDPQISHRVVHDGNSLLVRPGFADPLSAYVAPAHSVDILVSDISRQPEDLIDTSAIKQNGSPVMEAIQQASASQVPVGSSPDDFSGFQSFVHQSEASAHTGTSSSSLAGEKTASATSSHHPRQSSKAADWSLLAHLNEFTNSAVPDAANIAYSLPAEDMAENRAVFQSLAGRELPVAAQKGGDCHEDGGFADFAAFGSSSASTSAEGAWHTTSTVPLHGVHSLLVDARAAAPGDADEDWGSFLGPPEKTGTDIFGDADAMSVINHSALLNCGHTALAEVELPSPLSDGGSAAQVVHLPSSSDSIHSKRAVHNDGVTLHDLEGFRGTPIADDAHAVKIDAGVSHMSATVNVKDEPQPCSIHDSLSASQHKPISTAGESISPSVAKKRIACNDDLYDNMCPLPLGEIDADQDDFFGPPPLDAGEYEHDDFDIAFGKFASFNGSGKSALCNSPISPQAKSYQVAAGFGTGTESDLKFERKDAGSPPLMGAGLPQEITAGAKVNVGEIKAGAKVNVGSADHCIESATAEQVQQLNADDFCAGETALTEWPSTRDSAGQSLSPVPWTEHVSTTYNLAKVPCNVVASGAADSEHDGCTGSGSYDDRKHGYPGSAACSWDEVSSGGKLITKAECCNTPVPGASVSVSSASAHGDNGRIESADSEIVLDVPEGRNVFGNGIHSTACESLSDGIAHLHDLPGIFDDVITLASVRERNAKALANMGSSSTLVEAGCHSPGISPFEAFGTDAGDDEAGWAFASSPPPLPSGDEVASDNEDDGWGFSHVSRDTVSPVDDAAWDAFPPTDRQAREHVADNNHASPTWASEWAAAHSAPEVLDKGTLQRSMLHAFSASSDDFAESTCAKAGSEDLEKKEWAFAPTHACGDTSANLTQKPMACDITEAEADDDSWTFGETVTTANGEMTFQLDSGDEGTRSGVMPVNAMHKPAACDIIVAEANDSWTFGETVPAANDEWTFQQGTGHERAQHGVRAMSVNVMQKPAACDVAMAEVDDDSWTFGETVPAANDEWTFQHGSDQKVTHAEPVGVSAAASFSQSAALPSPAAASLKILQVAFTASAAVQWASISASLPGLPQAVSHMLKACHLWTRLCDLDSSSAVTGLTWSNTSCCRRMLHTLPLVDPVAAPMKASSIYASPSTDGTRERATELLMPVMLAPIRVSSGPILSTMATVKSTTETNRVAETTSVSSLDCDWMFAAPFPPEAPESILAATVTPVDIDLDFLESTSTHVPKPANQVESSASSNRWAAIPSNLDFSFFETVPSTGGLSATNGKSEFKKGS